MILVPKDGFLVFCLGKDWEDVSGGITTIAGLSAVVLAMDCRRAAGGAGGLSVGGWRYWWIADGGKSGQGIFFCRFAVIIGGLSGLSGRAGRGRAIGTGGLGAGIEEFL